MATSGSLNTSSYEGRYLQLTWSRQSYDIASNPATSNISWELRGAGSATSSWYYTGNFTVEINGQTVYQSSGRIQLYDGTLVASGTATIPHSADGTSTFGAYVAAGIYTTAVNVDGSGSWDIDALPRATTPSIGAVTLGSAVTISLPRASDSFTHNLTYKFGSASGTIATGAGASASWTPPLDLASQIPNSVSGIGTITCVTKNGSATIGTKTINFTASVPSSVVPAISSCTVTPVNDNTWINGKGIYVAGYTKVKVVTTAAGAYGSTIKSIAITGIGTGSGTTWTSGTLSAGTKTITIKVTDSRGRTKSVTRSFTVQPYAPPSISSLVCTRGAYSAGAWTSDTGGSDLRVTFTLGYSLGDYGNLANLSVAVSGETTQTTAGAGAGARTYYFKSIGTDVSRSVTITATDYVGKTTTKSATTSTVIVGANYNPEKRSFRIGGVAEDTDTFRCSFPAIFDKAVTLTIMAGSCVGLNGCTTYEQHNFRFANICIVQVYFNIQALSSGTAFMQLPWTPAKSTCFFCFNASGGRYKLTVNASNNVYCNAALPAGTYNMSMMYYTTD